MSISSRVGAVLFEVIDAAVEQLAGHEIVEAADDHGEAQAAGRAVFGIGVGSAVVNSRHEVALGL